MTHLTAYLRTRHLACGACGHKWERLDEETGILCRDDAPPVVEVRYDDLARDTAWRGVQPCCGAPTTAWQRERYAEETLRDAGWMLEPNTRLWHKAERIADADATATTKPRPSAPVPGAPGARQLLMWEE